ncbi:1-aminocyclopropane-1-carboxylate oxidase homolog 3-like protein [Tanacetum coccineum]
MFFYGRRNDSVYCVLLDLSMPPSSFPGPLTSLSYSSRPSRSAPSIENAECSNCKFLSENIMVWLSPMEPAWEMVPEMCRKALADWDKAVIGLAEELMSILCEGLGIKSDKLKEWSCLEGRINISHYYPQCPQPELTLGLTSHTDPCVLTVLVQN